MLRNDLYFGIKPLIPKAVRLALRRRVALRKRPGVENIWPIMPGSEQAPVGWPGWPDGKKFALILTHDVEGKAGVAKCEGLMRTEMERGFRSSFNFVPEGTYRVTSALREELARNGFEVGVHDLEHDGRLYRSRHEFVEKAQRINAYLKQWGVVGFRSGFMLSNLTWLHELDALYDMSTFDTDPFEPQPQGRHTIFPFWVSAPEVKGPDPGSSGSAADAAPAHDGYVELPYTLPQDSTLYLLLKETSADIWKSKLDWIAEHGGMALVNVHPDYVQFEGEASASSTYPVALYESFLDYARARFGDTFWQPLPREVAQFVRRLNPRPESRRRKRICMVSHSVYESDNRVTRYAEALAQRGDHVDVFALRRSRELPELEIIHGVHLFRVKDRFGKTERSRLAYLWPLLRFLRVATSRVTRSHRRNRYDLIHVHNVPDFMVFSAWYPKITGTPVILDIHDIVPEFYSSKFGDAPKGLLSRLLLVMERISAAVADHIIIANHLWRDKYGARTRSSERCSTFINNVDSNIFTPRPRRPDDGKQIILFPGGLQSHQGVDVALRAFQLVRREFPSAEFHIYGDGNAKKSLVALGEELGLNGSVKFRSPVDVREIARIMARADIGVVPKRADSFGNEAYSTKIMEFMAVGVPVVVSNTRVDRHYFDDSVVRFFPSGDAQALASTIIELLRDREGRRQLADRALQYAEQNCWGNRKHEYLNLVDSLCRDGTITPEHYGVDAAAPSVARSQPPAQSAFAKLPASTTSPH